MKSTHTHKVKLLKENITGNLVDLSRSVVSNSLELHGLWPARLPCPWDFPGKNTGVGCHCLLQGSSICDCILISFSYKENSDCFRI